MTTAELIEQLRTRALELTPAERELLAQELVAVSEELVGVADDEVDPALRAVVTQRVQSIRDGSAHLLSREEFFARVRAKIVQ